MGKEKRMIGDYTVLCSVNVGEKEVILASNEQSTNGEKFLCGFLERNDLFELCKECVVSDDYIEIAHIFGSRVANEAELFKEQVKKLDIPITVITEADCIPDHYSKDINGRVTFGNITRLDNALEGLPKRLEINEQELENVKTQFETAKVDVEKPFNQEEELKTKTARLNELNALLNVDKRENEIVGGEPDEGDEEPTPKSKDRER